MPLVIRQLADSDLESAGIILASAFRRTESWVAELRLYHAMQPDGYFGAYLDGSLVGMVGSTIYATFAYVGMMGVHQQFQRRGIGLALMKHLLQWLDQKGIPQVRLDASTTGQPMYEKLDFVAHERVLVLQGPAGGLVRKVPPRIRPILGSDLAQVTALDTSIFGADRSRVLSALHRLRPDRTILSRDGQGRIRGYLFMPERRIGPWVMLEPEDDETLLQAAMSHASDGLLSAVVPETNRRALEILQRNGFEVVRANRHMRRGSGPATGQRDRVYAQTSLSLG